MRLQGKQLPVIGKEFGLYSGDKVFQEGNDRLIVWMCEKSLWCLCAE